MTATTATGWTETGKKARGGGEGERELKLSPRVLKFLRLSTLSFSERHGVGYLTGDLRHWASLILNPRESGRGCNSIFFPPLGHFLSSPETNQFESRFSPRFRIKLLAFVIPIVSITFGTQYSGSPLASAARRRAKKSEG